MLNVPPLGGLREVNSSRPFNIIEKPATYLPVIYKNKKISSVEISMWFIGLTMTEIELERSIFCSILFSFVIKL